DSEELEVLLGQHGELIGCEAALDGHAALLALQARDEQRPAGYGARGWHGQSRHQMTSMVMWARPEPSDLSVVMSMSFPSGISSFLTLSNRAPRSMPSRSSRALASCGMKRSANLARAYGTLTFTSPLLESSSEVILILMKRGALPRRAGSGG